MNQNELIADIVIGTLAIATAAGIIIWWSTKVGSAAVTAGQAVGDAVSITDKNLLWRGINQTGDLLDDGLDNQSFDLGEYYRQLIGSNP